MKTSKEILAVFTPKTRRAFERYTMAACAKAYDLNVKQGEGASSILHGHDCGFRFVTVGQVDAAINAGAELAERSVK
jgi:hypothetical protein